MFRLLILCAVAVAAVRVVAETPREWTNASGTKRAQAVLLRIEGNSLWLRRSDGKLTTTTMSKLSERDRQYVTSLQSRSPMDSKAPGMTSSVIERLSDFVEAIQQLPKWLDPSQLGGARPLVPAALVYVRVSGDFLEDYIERTVRQRKDVRDCILGTRIVGQSDTRGQTRLTLIPSNDQLRAYITFYGNVRARTRGYKGPVVIHNTSDSTFQARKLIVMNDFGLGVAPAMAYSSTRLRTTCITTSLPRLRGRIATRIAWRRVSQTRKRAEAITSDHTADDIRGDLDREINRTMGNAHKVFGERIVALETGRSATPTDVRFRCRAEYVEMALIRDDATAEERKHRPPPAEENSDVSVRLHRTLLMKVVEDPQLMRNLSPILTKLSEALAKRGDAGRSLATGPRNGDAKWTIDGEWISLDFNDASH